MDETTVGSARDIPKEPTDDGHAGRNSKASATSSGARDRQMFPSIDIPFGSSAPRRNDWTRASTITAYGRLVDGFGIEWNRFDRILPVESLEVIMLC